MNEYSMDIQSFVMWVIQYESYNSQNLPWSNILGVGICEITFWYSWLLGVQISQHFKTNAISSSLTQVILMQTLLDPKLFPFKAVERQRNWYRLPYLDNAKTGRTFLSLFACHLSLSDNFIVESFALEGFTPYDFFFLTERPPVYSSSDSHQSASLFLPDLVLGLSGARFGIFSSTLSFKKSFSLAGIHRRFDRSPLKLAWIPELHKMVEKNHQCSKERHRKDQFQKNYRKRHLSLQYLVAPNAAFS